MISLYQSSSQEKENSLAGRARTFLYQVRQKQFKTVCIRVKQKATIYCIGPSQPQEGTVGY